MSLLLYILVATHIGISIHVSAPIWSRTRGWPRLSRTRWHNWRPDPASENQKREAKYSPYVQAWREIIAADAFVYVGSSSGAAEASHVGGVSTRTVQDDVPDELMLCQDGKNAGFQFQFQVSSGCCGCGGHGRWQWCAGGQGQWWWWGMAAGGSKISGGGHRVGPIAEVLSGIWLRRAWFEFRIRVRVDHGFRLACAVDTHGERSPLHVRDWKFDRDKRSRSTWHSLNRSQCFIRLFQTNQSYIRRNLHATFWRRKKVACAGRARPWQPGWSSSSCWRW
jgi:hypothetical protein